MAKFQFEIPLDKLPNVNKEEVLNYINSKTFYETLVTYARNWIYASKRDELSKWIKENLKIDEQIKKDLKNVSELKTNREKIIKILKYVIVNIKYAKDQTVWKTPEYWQNPTETWKLKTGDCEDGAILIYAIARYFNIPDYQLYITTGDVVGGGHCYLIFVDDKNALEYPIDYCYWPDKSLKMTPYILRDEYFNGKSEWFKFNATSGWKLK